MGQEITTLENEIKQLDTERDVALIATLTTQVKVAQSKKELYETKVSEIQDKLDKLKEVVNGE